MQVTIDLSEDEYRVLQKEVREHEWMHQAKVADFSHVIARRVYLRADCTQTLLDGTREIGRVIADAQR